MWRCRVYMGPMFGRLLSGLMTPAPAALPDTEANLALAALLVRLARADGHYSDVETRRIDLIVATRYGLAPVEATALRRDAEILESEAPDTVRFTRAIKEAVPYEDRLSLMEALWQVALADTTRNPDEDALIRLAASLLGVADMDSALARQRVERT